MESHRFKQLLGLLVATALVLARGLAAAEFSQITPDSPSKSNWNSEPSWSPDGKQIAYTHAELDRSNQFTSWIEVIPAEGGKPVRLRGQQTADSPLLNSHASWSPAGERLVFAAGSGLYFSSPRDRNPPLLVPGLHQEGNPVWSPDGSHIAFESDVRGIRTVCLIASTGGPVQSFPTSHGALGTPAWSPDGERLACAVWSSKGRDLWIVPTVGGVWHSVTRGDSDDTSPAWSPNGTLLAYVSNRSGNLDIWIVAIQGGDPVQLTTDPGDDVDPSWSPDGKRIAFASTRSGKYQVWIASDLPPPNLVQRSWEPPKTLGR